jgi:hypothetical protein
MVALGSPAFAAATPSVSTPLGTVVVEDGLDSVSGLLSVTFTAPGPAGGLAPVSVTVDRRRGTVALDSHRPSFARPSAPRSLPGPASEAVPALPADSPISSCGLALVVLPDALPTAACAPADGFTGAPGLGAVVLGTSRGSFSPNREPGVPASISSANADFGAADGEEAGVGTDPGFDAVGLALGGVRHVNTSSMAGAQSAAPAGGAGPSGMLAVTGTPLLAGLTGLVLLVVGGVLTWKRVRD